MQDIYEKLISKLDKDRVLKNESMSKHTTFKVGGTADYYIRVYSVEELKYVLNIANQENINVTIVGNGSNILVKDGGIRGFTVQLKLSNIEIENETIINVESGALLSKIAFVALENSLTGIEFASGIPGTLGGAVRMNAGAYGKEMKNVILETTYLNKNLQIRTINNEENYFTYRKSRFLDSKDDIILSAKILLDKGKKENIKLKMDEYKALRKEKQPLNFPNAGSFFKRGQDFITAELIDKTGLKGLRIGDAEVSTKHAGFIINKGNATAKDILELANIVQKKVYEKFNKKIEFEIEVLGED